MVKTASVSNLGEMRRNLLTIRKSKITEVFLVGCDRAG